MSSTWGNKIKISVFGESHGAAIGVVIDGLKPGFTIDKDKVLRTMARRAPGKSFSTSRAESDEPIILSGVKGNVTTGSPLCAMIKNTNTRSGDYGGFSTCPRPGHADFTAFAKYGKANFFEGGGHFSGRITAPICFAGEICRQILENEGIEIFAHINSIGNAFDTPFEKAQISKELTESLLCSDFPLVNSQIKKKMLAEIEDARSNLDSVGGTVECMITGVKAGVGEPMFDGIENRISSLVFGIPAVKGIEFGSGFELAKMRGSQSNDEFFFDENKNVVTKTNNCGGILGGISNGMPILFRTAIKPTPSISKTQKTVDLENGVETQISVKGRHDPCIVPRAVPVIECAAAIAILDLM